MKDDLNLCIVSVPNIEIAKLISKDLITKGLAACVSIVPNIISIYSWEDKIEESQELLLIIKSNIKLFEKLSTNISNIHPYEIPEIISIPLNQIEEKYKQWMLKELVKI